MGRPRRFEFLTNVSGQNERDGVFRMTPASAEYIQNLHYTQNGTFSAYNQGYDEFTAQLESGADIDSLGVFETDGGTQSFLVATNGKVYNISFADGSSSGTITTGLTAGNFVDFQTFKGSVYFTDGAHTPLKWSGSGSASGISSLPKTISSDTYDKPKLVSKFNNRLVWGNFQDTTSGPYRSHITISDTLTPDTITTATMNATDGAVAQISPGDGQELTNLQALYIPQQNEEVLICFKERSTYVVTGTTPSTFTVTLLSNTYGCLNNRCAAQVGNDIIFLDERNIYSLSTATESGNLQRNVIGSDKVAETLATLNVSQKEKAWVEHIPERFEVWFAFPTGSSSAVDTILVYNYRNAEAGEHVWITRTGMDARCAVYYDGYFYTGDTDGYVNKWFAVSNYKGVGFNWIYRYPFYNFEDQTRTKKIKSAFVGFGLRSPETIGLKWEWVLGGNNTKQTYSRTKTLTAGSVWDSANWDSFVWAIDSSLIRHEKVDIKGNGLMWQFEVNGTTGILAPDFLGVWGHLEIGDFNRSSR